jgi:polyphosphate glucokinase
MNVLGVDIGGSGIKAAVVNTRNGELESEPMWVATPQPATPTAVAQSVSLLVNKLSWKGLIGCGFPAIIREGTALSAANVDHSWVDINVENILSETTDCLVHVLNDADAAGLAERYFGAGKEENGTLLVLTLGTGIGSALFFQGRLIPNLELGHLSLHGKVAEHYASAAVRTIEKLSWQAWSERLNCFLAQVERVISPDLIVIGGGVSHNSERFLPLLKTRAQLVAAYLQNQAGIIGAASYAGKYRRNRD